MIEKLFINWDDFHHHTKQLAQDLLSKRKFNRIVAISRGGLVPAGILAYEMNIRNCDTINISSYDDDVKREDADIEQKFDLSNIDEQTIFIDDLSDSGRTIKTIRKQYPAAHIACVYVKPNSDVQPDSFYCKLPDKWIVFPWD
ncbi:MAG: xanthine phosphoribosyltransferase [Alphaproteobacteria bacterium]|nr:xanthine phosphoribosyltransferase [Alphaproteobacteria bacterium]